MKRIRNIVLSKNAEQVFNSILNDVVSKKAKVDNYDEEVINYALEAFYAMEEIMEYKKLNIRFNHDPDDFYDPNN